MEKHSSLIALLCSVTVILAFAFKFKTTEVQVPLVVPDIILAGDIMLGRSVMAESQKRNDPFYPFRKVADRLKQADLVFANLESPITEGCQRHEGGFRFCTGPEVAEGLTFAGIDVVSLANNHTLNYSQDGLAQTKRILTEKGIGWVGFGELVIREVGGVKFGFLGFDLTVRALADSDLKLVAETDKLCDILLVGVHWGEEYKDKATELQRDQAKMLVESGADVIAGHHPHWTQNMEYIDEKPVFYSLGNFVFDQMWSEETKKGLAVELTFKENELMGIELLPIYVFSLGQPEFMD